MGRALIHSVGIAATDWALLLIASAWTLRVSQGPISFNMEGWIACAAPKYRNKGFLNQWAVLHAGERLRYMSS